MPPFGVEKEEPADEKRLPYLSLGGLPSRPKRAASGPFGAESSEHVTEPVQGSQQARPRREAPTSSSHGPFHAEPDEVLGRTTTSSQGKTRPPRSLSGIFGSEPAEESSVEPESDSSEDEQANFRGTSQTVHSLGWHSLLDLKKATFWKGNMDSAPTKKKRRYNNSNRQAQAAYARKNTEGAFQRNGVDPQRLKKLFELPSCQCPLFVHQRIFVNFGVRVDHQPPRKVGPPVSRKILLRWEQRLLQAVCQLKGIAWLLEILLGYGKARSRLLGPLFKHW